MYRESALDCYKRNEMCVADHGDDVGHIHFSGKKSCRLHLPEDMAYCNIV